MATISFGGLGNGLDFGPVVDQLVKVAHLPVDRLTEKKATLNSKSTDYATLSTKLIMLQAAADKLRLSTSFDRSAASVSDTSILSATGDSTASPGTYALQVTQLAQAHQVVSKAAKTVAATTTDIVSGASGTFTFSVGGGANQTVTLSATATLDDLKTAINDLGAGVTASIINTGSDTTPAYRLALTSNSTGASNGITVVADDTDLDMINTSGTGGVDTLQAAQDATVVVGSSATVTLTRSSNTITDAIPGVTLTLTGTTSGTSTVQVNVTRDLSAVKENITAFATAYNDVVKFINERNTYDVTTRTGGIFFNEPTVRTVLSKIRTALSSTVAGVSSLGTTGEIGFKSERDGTVTVDTAKLDSVLNSSYSAVKNLFIRQTGITGVAQLMSDAVDALDDLSAGTVTLRKSALTKQITTLTDDIAKKEDAVSQYETRLRAQYAALDGLLSQLKSQSNYLTSLSSSSGR